jgi:hypothetical protein
MVWYTLRQEALQGSLKEKPHCRRVYGTPPMGLVLKLKNFGGYCVGVEKKAGSRPEVSFWSVI